MIQGYPTTVTPNVTFNPYLPLTGRVLEVLLSYGPAGSAIETCNRDLARLALCSAGAIPGALRTLEAHGYIERITTPRGSLIEVIDRSLMPDRSFAASGCDQGISDRPIEAGAEMPDRPPKAIADRSAMTDPPLHPPIRNKHESLQQQQPRVRDSSLVDDQDVPPVVPEARWEIPWHAIRLANPGYTHADFNADLDKARTRPDIESIVGLTVKAKLRGEPVYSLEELHARATDRPGPAHAVTRRRDTQPAAAGRTAPAKRSTEPSDADIERLRASFAAAPPLSIDVRLPELRH